MHPARDSRLTNRGSGGTARIAMPLATGIDLAQTIRSEGWP